MYTLLLSPFFFQKSGRCCPRPERLGVSVADTPDDKGGVAGER